MAVEAEMRKDHKESKQDQSSLEEAKVQTQRTPTETECPQEKGEATARLIWTTEDVAAKQAQIGCWCRATWYHPPTSDLLMTMIIMTN